jgi:hypothetical protein
MVGIALSWGCVKPFRDNVAKKGRCHGTIGSLLRYRLRKRETTPRTAAVRNDNFKVKSSDMLKDRSLDDSERACRVPTRSYCMPRDGNQAQADTWSK